MARKAARAIGSVVPVARPMKSAANVFNSAERSSGIPVYSQRYNLKKRTRPRSGSKPCASRSSMPTDRHDQHSHGHSGMFGIGQLIAANIMNSATRLYISEVGFVAHRGKAPKRRGVGRALEDPRRWTSPSDRQQSVRLSQARNSTRQVPSDRVEP